MLFFLKKKKANLIESWSPTVLTLVTILIFFISTFIFYSSVLPVSCNELWNILQFVYIFNSCTYSFPSVKECRVYGCTYLKSMQEARSKTHTLPRPGELCVLWLSAPLCLHWGTAWSSELHHLRWIKSSLLSYVCSPGHPQFCEMGEQVLPSSRSKVKEFCNQTSFRLRLSPFTAETVGSFLGIRLPF